MARVDELRAILEGRGAGTAVMDAPPAPVAAPSRIDELRDILAPGEVAPPTVRMWPEETDTVNFFGVQFRPHEYEYLTRELEQPAPTGFKKWLGDPVLNEEQVNVLNELRRQRAIKAKGDVGIGEMFARKDWAQVLPILGSVHSAVNLARTASDAEIVGGLNEARLAAEKAGERYKPTWSEVAAERRLANYIEVAEELELRRKTIPAQILEGVTDMVPYALEFMMTAGWAASIKSGAQKVGAKLLLKHGGTKVGRALIKTGVAVTKAIAPAGVRTGTVFAPKVAESYISRRLGELDWTDKGKAIFKGGKSISRSIVEAFGEVIISSMAEESGEVLGKGVKTLLARVPGARAIAKKGSGVLARLWKSKGGSAAVMAKFREAGYHGVFNEMLEEEVEALAFALTGIEDFGLEPDVNTVLNRLRESIPNFEQLLVQGGIFTIPAMGRKAALWATRGRKAPVGIEQWQDLSEDFAELAQRKPPKRLAKEVPLPPKAPARVMPKQRPEVRADMIRAGLDPDKRADRDVWYQRRVEEAKAPEKPPEPRAPAISPERARLRAEIAAAGFKVRPVEGKVVPTPPEPRVEAPRAPGWKGFPLRKDLGEQPSAKDIPPERTPAGDFVIYHGTDARAAQKIISSRTIRADDTGAVGFTTTADAADTYAVHKIARGKPTILRLVVSKDWMAKQELRHEIGGPGASAFLAQPDYATGAKASIPKSAILSVESLGKPPVEAPRAPVMPAKAPPPTPAPPKPAALVKPVTAREKAETDLARKAALGSLAGVAIPRGEAARNVHVLMRDQIEDMLANGFENRPREGPPQPEGMKAFNTWMRGPMRTEVIQSLRDKGVPQDMAESAWKDFTAPLMPTKAPPKAVEAAKAKPVRAPAPVEAVEKEPGPKPDISKTEQAMRIDKDVVRVPVAAIKIDPAKFQYKQEVDEFGVQQPLEGPWDDIAAGIGVVWQDKAGDIWAINVHHRLELAKRTEQSDIRVVVLRESEGITAKMARRRGAHLNLKEGKGTRADEAEYWRFTEKEDLREAIKDFAGNPRNRVGFQIGRYATDNTYALWRSGKLSDGQAAAVSNAAPNNAPKQAAAIDFVEEQPEAGAASVKRFLDATAALERRKGMKQGALFAGMEDVRAELAAQKALHAAAEKRIRALQSDRAGIRSASKLEQSKMAKRYDIEVRTPADIGKVDARLAADIVNLERYWTHPDVMRQLEADIRGPTARMFQIIRKPVKIVEEFAEAAKRGVITQKVVDAVKRAAKFAERIGLPVDYRVSLKLEGVDPNTASGRREIMEHGYTAKEIRDATARGETFEVSGDTETYYDATGQPRWSRITLFPHAEVDAGFHETGHALDKHFAVEAEGANEEARADWIADKFLKHQEDTLNISPRIPDAVPPSIPKRRLAIERKAVEPAVPEEVDQDVTDIVAHVAAVKGDKGPKIRLPRGVERAPDWIRRIIRTGWDYNERPYRTVKRIDGSDPKTEGPMERTVHKPLMDAARNEMKFTDAFHDEMKAESKKTGIDDRFFNKVVDINDTLKVDGSGMIAVYNAQFDDGHMRHLVESEWMSEAEMADVLARMPQAAKEYGDWMREKYAEIHPKLDDMRMDTYGEGVGYIEGYAGPVRVEVEDYIGLLNDDLMARTQAPPKPGIQPKFFKKRVRSTAEAPKVMSSLWNFVNYMKRANHFLAYAPTYKRVKAILWDKRTAEALHPTDMAWLRTWFERTTGTEQRGRQGWVGGMFAWLRRQSVPSVLGVSMTVAPKQAVSINTALAHYPEIAPFLVQELVEEAKLVATGRPFAYHQMVSALSIRCKLRRERWIRELRESSERMQRKSLKYWTRGKTILMGKVMAHISAIDVFAVDPIWMASYKYQIAQDKSPLDGERFGDKVIMTTQPTSEIIELPQLWSGPEIDKMFTVFTNQLNQKANIIVEDILAVKAGKMKARRMAYELAIIYALNAYIIAVISHGRPPEWKEYVAESIGGPLRGIQPFGTLLEPASKYAVLGESFEPGVLSTQAIESFWRALTTTRWETKGKYFAKGLANVTGIPWNQPYRTATGAHRLWTGTTEDWRELIWSRYMIERPSERGKKGVEAVPMTFPARTEEPKGKRFKKAPPFKLEGVVPKKRFRKPVTFKLKSAPGFPR